MENQANHGSYRTILASSVPRASTLYVTASLGCVLLFLILSAMFFFIYRYDRYSYMLLLSEDRLIERLTFVLLMLTAALSFFVVWWNWRKQEFPRYFLLLFAAFCLFLALEEISWGQRIFGIESNEFFKSYSDQRETNIHNTVQLFLKKLGSPVNKTRHFAAIILFLYGVCLPVLQLHHRTALSLRKLKLVIPPPALIPGFLIGAVLTWFDEPTGQEEEFGEFLFSLCFFLLLPMWLLRQHTVSDT